MIYSTEIKEFPNKVQYSQCYSYKDENGFEWKIAMVENGFFVAYFGDHILKTNILALKM